MKELTGTKAFEILIEKEFDRDEKRKISHLKAVKKYYQSEKGKVNRKEYQKKYRQTEAGREYINKKNSRWRQTEAGREYYRKYNQSEKRKIYLKEYDRKRSQTEKRKEYYRKYNQSEKRKDFNKKRSRIYYNKNKNSEKYIVRYLDTCSVFGTKYHETKEKNREYSKKSNYKALRMAKWHFSKMRLADYLPQNFTLKEAKNKKTEIINQLRNKYEEQLSRAV